MTLFSRTAVLVPMLMVSGAALGQAQAPFRDYPAAYQALARAAEQSLSENIVTLPTGPVLRAGSHQFGSLWTRDFCFAVPGLLAAGRADVVKNQLTRLLTSQNEAALVPRGMDSINPVKRVLAYTLLRGLGHWIQPQPVGEPLLPEYLGEHKTIAADSNLLVLFAASTYAEETGDQAWWSAHEAELVRVYRFYDARRDDAGLIRQERYSDWQDSVERDGRTAYLNLLDLVVAQKLRARPAFGVVDSELARRRAAFEAIFFDQKAGLYRALEGREQIGLDVNLLALSLGYAEVADHVPADIWGHLSTHPLWQSPTGVGFNTYPDYPLSSVSFSARSAGLRHYHDSYYWSWLMALSGRVAFCMGDAARSAAVLSRLQDNAVRDGGIAEIYEDEAGLPAFAGSRYLSEMPFSWGSGMTLSSLKRMATGCGNGL